MSSNTIRDTQSSSALDLNKFIRDVTTLVAESITRFVMSKIPRKRVREVNVVVTLRDPKRLLFEIDVEVLTDALVKDEEVNRVVDEAVDYGFKLLDEIVPLIERGVYDLAEIRRAIKRVERQYINPDTQKR